MDPISLALSVGSQIAEVFGGASRRDAEYEAQALATRERNNAAVRSRNRALLRIFEENNKRFVTRKNQLLDYDRFVDDATSAGHRAFARNEKNVQGALDTYKLADQKAFVELTGGFKANEGGRSSAANINRLRDAGRQAGMRSGMRSKLLEDQYAANQDLAREVNERLSRAHDSVFKKVQYNTLMPEKPVMLEAPARPSQWETVSGLLGVAGSLYGGIKSMQTKDPMKQDTNTDQTDMGSNYNQSDLGLDYERYMVKRNG